MGTIKSLYRKAQGLDIDNIIDESLKAEIDQGEGYESLVRKQLTAGFNSKGSRFRPYKNKRYAQRKFQMNPLPGYGNPDLKLTGQFHRSIYATSSRDVIDVLAADRKADRLLKDYPGSLLLGGAYRGEFVKTRLRPAILTRIRKRIRL